MATAGKVLIDLHCQRWQEDADGGAFASPRFRAFHEDFQEQMLAEGHLQLDWLTVRGEPILYGMSIPTGAPHPTAARQFLDFLLTPDALRQLRAAHVDMLDHPIVVGAGAPPELTRGARR